LALPDDAIYRLKMADSLSVLTPEKITIFIWDSKGIRECKLLKSKNLKVVFTWKNWMDKFVLMDKDSHRYFFVAHPPGGVLLGNVSRDR